jgi:REP element-mobilizing transposase RayT
LATHTQHTEHNRFYFCTITCYKWLNLLQEANAYDAVYNWFSHLKQSECQVCGYVIMPNHLHVLLFPANVEKSLNHLISQGKRFMAYDIVKRLKQLRRSDLLKELQEGVEANERTKGKKHQVFRLSFDARVCFDEKMLLQKLDYIHHNPVKGKWNLASDFVEYKHSSAVFYERGQDDLGVVTHFKDVEVVPSESSRRETLIGVKSSNFHHHTWLGLPSQRLQFLKQRHSPAKAG